MKKFFDKCLFSKFGTQLIVSILLVVTFSAIAPMLRRIIVGTEFHGGFQSLGWGLRQVATPNGAVGTIETLDAIPGTLPRIAMLLLLVCCWMICIGVFSFITGSIVNWFRNRKQVIDSGQMRYTFRDHGLVIGWDFQGPSCVKELLKTCDEVLVVSRMEAATIRRELKTALRTRDLSRVYIYNGLITPGKSTLVNAWPEFSRQIVILGERDGSDNDGGNLQIERVLRNHIRERAAKFPRKRPPIKIYLHLEDSVLYTQALAVPKAGFSEDDDLIDLEVYNYYESWAWRCWSLKDACDGDRDDSPDAEHAGDPYLPLRHKPDAERVELFIIGSTLMGQAMATYAVPLMTYGIDRKHCKITLFDERPSGGDFLPEKWVLDALPEAEVVFKNISGGSDAANTAMLTAAADPKTAVTIVIATVGSDAAVKSYAALANSLRRMDVSILVWQATATDKCPGKSFLQTCGDCAKLRFFGMTDCLPWLHSARQANGCAVNYFYDLAFNRDAENNRWYDADLPEVLLPEAAAENLVRTAEEAWLPELAMTRWRRIPRWAKWSSINSGDSFREKAAAFPDCAVCAETRTRVLHAEHNRWWSERLLAGWKPCPKPMDADRARRKQNESALKSAYLHWDLVPFDQLDAFTRELDRVTVAAMAVRGYLPKGTPSAE